MIHYMDQWIEWWRSQQLTCNRNVELTDALGGLIKSRLFLLFDRFLLLLPPSYYSIQTFENKTSLTTHFKKLTTGNNVFIVWDII